MEIKMSEIECVVCGVGFFMPETLRVARKNDKKPFFCPNGHPQNFSVSEAEDLKKKLAQVEGSLEFWKNSDDMKSKIIIRLDRKIKRLEK